MEEAKKFFIDRLTNRENIKSIDLAKFINMRNSELNRKINRYKKVFKENNINFHEFFIESTYITKQNKVLNCYELTPKGIDFIMLKFTGARGVIFAAMYVQVAALMEERFKSLEKLTVKDQLLELIKQEELKEIGACQS